MIKHSDYDDVQSLSAKHKGRKFSVGIFEPCERTFTPECFEQVSILKGALQVNETTFKPGSSFQLPSDETARFQCDEPVAYLCEYSGSVFLKPIPF